MKKISGRRQTTPDIPTASTADIAFLLIIFFMVSTHLRSEQGLKISLPAAERTERIIKRRNVAAIWMDKTGRTTINDNLVTTAGVTSIMAEKIADNPDLVAMLFADRDVPYGYVTDVLEALKDARALKVTFATGFKIGGGAR
ncbi:MAG: biopolymer transporter ExbD [candidate division WOR-3 bacterium]